MLWLLHDLWGFCCAGIKPFLHGDACLFPYTSPSTSTQGAPELQIVTGQRLGMRAGPVPICGAHGRRRLSERSVWSRRERVHTSRGWNAPGPRAGDCRARYRSRGMGGVRTWHTRERRGGFRMTEITIHSARGAHARRVLGELTQPPSNRAVRTLTH